MNIRKSLSYFFLFSIAFAIAFTAGYWANSFLHPRGDFPQLDHVYAILENHAYDPLPAPPALEYGAIHGLVNAFGDPHTRFVEPAQHELDSNRLNGSYGGIGATLERDPDGFVVLHPYADSPASRAGVRDGDRLLAVDDLQITAEISLDDVVAAIRGPEGEEVTLTILRSPAEQTLTVSIARANIPLPSVTWNLAPAEPRLGVVHVNVIASSSAEEIQKAVRDLQTNGATHFALDLRGNGGGLLDAGVEIARLFLAEGDIIEYRYREQAVTRQSVKTPGALSEIPLVLLVDGNTASASEIIGGALQVHGRALLIGAATFGKDSIQSIFDLGDGSSLHVTSARWWVPGLEPPIGEGGLQPDIPVPLEGSSERDVVLEAAIQYFFGTH
jgi:carboxyl-terminal processing protease